MESIAVQIPLLILVVVVWRLAAGAMDRKRIRKHVESLGGSLLECHWTFWGPDYFGDRDSRIYAVRYVDRDRDTRMAYCKTCLWGGVYFTRETVVPSDKSDCSDDALEKENCKLDENCDRLAYDELETIWMNRSAESFYLLTCEPSVETRLS